MSAVISHCGHYRYRLERSVGMIGPVYAYFGINPSTGDASKDDATVRKWIGFTKVWGGSRFIVGNVFAYRATDVRTLAGVDRPSGQENVTHLFEIMRDADILVPCWGNSSKVPKQLRLEFSAVMLRLLESGKPVMHLGLTMGGDPKHPLILGYDTPLVQYGH
jgi:hypothetical protein